MRLQLWSVGALAVLLVAGCSGSSSKPAVLPAGATSTGTSGTAAPATAGTTAGTPSGAAPAATSPGPATSPAGATTSAAVPPSAPATSTPVTARTTTALSPFELDPGIKALRAWAAQVAKTINTGHYIDPQLRALMSPAFSTQMKDFVGTDVHLHYPGPLPFQPLAVSLPTPSRREVKLCDIEEGFALAKNGKPAKPLLVGAARASVVLTGGRWIVEDLVAATDFSCKGVKVRAPKW